VIKVNDSVVLVLKNKNISVSYQFFLAQFITKLMKFSNDDGAKCVYKEEDFTLHFSKIPNMSETFIKRIIMLRDKLQGSEELTKALNAVEKKEIVPGKVFTVKDEASVGLIKDKTPPKIDQQSVLTTLNSRPKEDPNNEVGNAFPVFNY
jgi:hypothetical protein